MEKGWDAAGLLSPLWGRVGGRDALARLIGVQPSTLSGYNTGRLRMGEGAGRRIAAALGVTLEELGAPPESAHPSPILQEVGRVRTEIAELRAQIDRILEREVGLAGLVDKQMTLLEKQSRLLESIEARVDPPGDHSAAAPGRARRRKR